MSTAKEPGDLNLRLRPLEWDAIALSEQEIEQAAASALVERDPEQAWSRYLRSLILMALRRELRRLDAAVVVGPELEPEAPDRMLALNGRATQLLWCSLLAEEVTVPLLPWRNTATAPQLLIAAQVDEDNGTVRIQGVLGGRCLTEEASQGLAMEPGATSLQVPLARFEGGLPRLLRWVTVLDPEALPRVGIQKSGEDPNASSWRWESWRDAWLTVIPPRLALQVAGARGSKTSVKLIAPHANLDPDGTARAHAVCASPSLWSEEPLAEMQLLRDGQLLWRLQASSRRAIEGPMAWPIAPLWPEERLTLRLRPYGAAGGAYAVITLIGPNTDQLNRCEVQIERLMVEALAASSDGQPWPVRQDPALSAEVMARLGLVHQQHEEARP